MLDAGQVIAESSERTYPNNDVDAFRHHSFRQLRHSLNMQVLGRDVRELTTYHVVEMMMGFGVWVVEDLARIDDDLSYQTFFQKQTQSVVDRSLRGFAVMRVHGGENLVS